MPRKRKRQSFQEIFVGLLDKRIPAENLPNRKRISVREALLRKLIEFAARGHPAAVAMVADRYAHFDIAAEREEEQRAADEAFNATVDEALKRWGTKQ